MDEQHLRVSDAERNAVVDELRTHAAAGRLSLDEFGDRTAEALRAVTRADLHRVLRELPAAAAPAAPARAPVPPPPRRPTHAFPTRAFPWATAVRIGVAVVAASFVLSTGLWWVLFPVFFWTGGFGLFGGCGSRARSGRRGGWAACGSDAGWSRTDTRRTDTRRTPGRPAPGPDPTGTPVDEREIVSV